MLALPCAGVIYTKVVHMTIKIQSKPFILEGAGSQPPVRGRVEGAKCGDPRVPAGPAKPAVGVLARPVAGTAQAPRSVAQRTEERDGAFEAGRQLASAFEARMARQPGGVPTAAVLRFRLAFEEAQALHDTIREGAEAPGDLDRLGVWLQECRSAAAAVDPVLFGSAPARSPEGPDATRKMTKQLDVLSRAKGRVLDRLPALADVRATAQVTQLRALKQLNVASSMIAAARKTGSAADLESARLWLSRAYESALAVHKEQAQAPREKDDSAGH